MQDVNDNAPSHYRSAYQHWDFALKVGLSYLEGCTTKYVTRWRKKEGMKDLWKAMQYLDKMIMTGDYDIKRNNIAIDEELDRFATANDLEPIESHYIFVICTHRNEKSLKTARLILSKIMNEAKEKEEQAETKLEISRPGTPEDGGHHSRQTD